MQRDRDYLVSIARRYYVDERSQQQIAQEFGLSRPTVSNLLRKCRELGIVQIKIEDGYPYATAAGDELKKRYRLDHAIIVPSTDDDNVMTAVGTVAAEYTTSLLAEHIRIGIAWGTSLYHMVHQLPHERVKDSSVVQLMGGFGASSPQYDGADLAREFSKRIHAQYYPLQCPVLVKNIMVKELLLKELGIKETMQRTKSLDLAFVGISSNFPNQSAMVRAGFVTEKEAKEIQDAGAVGHLCGYSFDSEGKLLDISYNHRIIGIDFHDFLAIRTRVGIAYGVQKAQAIRASLIGGHITTLITDEVTANQILS
ncbi:MAG: sugar-binding transcriptional regulator [Sphaerochaetaceae bacterium]|nr:sugar-binding transcriptional regulator [Sphaerochaetaceae bacterium]MDD3942960.1 sugar-binding transcriptional regulator [Sphaerochaetaceae bacterium]MDX9938442.1 sugar-binding transcriptional regulator [Sphaerochaetaceae bacterium]